MTARTHNAFAIAALLTATAFFPPNDLNVLTLVGSVVAADIGALFPDMDQAGNDLWNLMPARHTIGGILRRVFYKHRTITHSLVGVYLVYRFLEWILPKLINVHYVDPHLILISFMIGYISHLIADGFTEEGVPLLFPINLNFGIPPIKSWRIKTGHWFEKFVVFPAVWIYVIWFVYRNQDTFMGIFRQIKRS